ncbi:SDR family NAD(P)-dependent oxidoreductase [Corynebacterium resistens]|uniref:SDR family NAD(P)-dependent oxidoreductase n=1 Tax=Corynebacterium resistens TaxID=258224 RepID=UPI002354735D|nr:SDR family NAD(P)-dependent oxidoreductase [Corynebacterium resistens]
MDESTRSTQDCPQPSDTHAAPSSPPAPHHDSNTTTAQVNTIGQSTANAQVNTKIQNTANAQVNTKIQNTANAQVNTKIQNTANTQVNAMSHNRSQKESQRKVAVVTGAGSGLGRLFSQELARKGWSIVAVGRTRETLEDTIASFESYACSDSAASFESNACSDSAASFENDPSSEVYVPCESDASLDSESTSLAQENPLHLPLVCDIGDEVGVEKMFEQATATFGRLDLLVNNAGAPGPTGEIHTIDIEDFDRTVRTNLRGAFLCTQHAFAWMKDHGGGRIINNGSIAATRPRPSAATYAATKAAIASLTVSTNLDGRPYNIRATELDIGNARTDLLGSFTSTEPMFDATRAAQLLASVAELPLDVCVDQLTVTAAGMPFLGRG